MSLKTDELRKEIDKHLVFDFEGGYFVRKTSIGRAKAGKRAGFISKDGKYSIICLNRKDYFEHNLVWFYFNGEFPPDGFEVDHENRVRPYNHPDNLRLGTRTYNNANMALRKDNRAGYRGVHFNKEKKKYCAQVTKNRKTKTLGYFASAKEAAEAVANERDKLFGKFAHHPNLDR